MHRQPDAVAGAVHEVLAQPGVGQHVARGGVDVGGAHTRAHRGHRGGLRALQHRVVLGDLRRRLADAIGAGAVGVVAGLHRAADVDDDDVAVAQCAIGAFVVRVSPVGAGADDDECGFRMSFGDNGFGDVGSDLCFGAPGYEETRHPRVHPVDGRTGGAQRLDLRVVLDHPQARQHLGGQHRGGAEMLGQRQQVQRGHGVGDRHPGVAAEGVGDQSVGVLAIGPVTHAQSQIGGCGLA